MENIKKKNAVMIADTRPALVGTLLLQLKNTNPELFEEAIIYYIDEISEQDKAVMKQIMPCRFIEYNYPLPSSLFEKPRFRLFSPLMFCRYEMPAYLDEFETITWLDTDILIQGRIDGIIKEAKKTGAAFIREDPIHKTSEQPDYMRTCFSRDLYEYRTDEYLYCSGTIVMSDRIKSFQNLRKWCYEKTIEWSEILSLPDQGVLNAAIQEFNIPVAPLSGKKYCCYPYMGRDCSEASIIHTWGRNKFWNDWYIYLHYPKWNEYYGEWQELGGSPLPFEIAPKISVIIPSYKPNLSYMKECLDSLMNQNREGWERFSDFEIIIVAEPFEEEPLKELVGKYHDKRICLEFNEEKLGIAASLNRGMRLAKGKYIARVDDDDICASSRMFLQAEYLEQNEDITLCTTDFEYFGDMNERRVSFEGDMCFAWSIFTCPFDHPTIMFRRDFFIDNNLFYDETRGYVEDWELWRRAFAKGMKVGCIHKPLFYHRWINSSSAGQTNKTVEMMRELVKRNFAELDVEILDKHLSLIGPWNGMLVENGERQAAENYFRQALENNAHKQLYNQNSLKACFDLRVEEIKTGILPGLSEKIVRKEELLSSPENSGEREMQNSTKMMRNKANPLKHIIKAILKPLYRPFRHRYEDRLIELQQNSWINGGHHLNEITKLDQIIEQNESLARQVSDLLCHLSSLDQTLAQQQSLLGRLDNLERIMERQQSVLNRISDLTLVLSQQQKIFDQGRDIDNHLTAIEDYIWNVLGWRQQMIEKRVQRSADAQMIHMLTLDKPSRFSQVKRWDSLYDMRFFWDNCYGSMCSGQIILESVFSEFPHESVVDFGCGTGTWLWAAQALGAKHVLGLDGDYVPRALLLISEQDFRPVDLEKPVSLDKKYDLAISVEVAEHLHADAADVYVDSICNSADNVLFSAAHPGQGGDGHLNEQPIEYWIEKFATRGFSPVYVKEKFASDERIEIWYRENIIAFRKEKGGRN